MKIIDILKESANILGLTQEFAILQGTTEETEHVVCAENPNISSLYNLINYSIRELCTNYLPVLVQKQITTENKQYPISNLSNFIRVKNVMKNEEMISFKVINRTLIFEEDGVYDVLYATYPSVESMFDEIDFLQNLSPDTITLGLCSYYSLAHGMFDEFDKLHEKYIEKAESLKELKIFNLPVRRWEWKLKSRL